MTATTCSATPTCAYSSMQIQNMQESCTLCSKKRKEKNSVCNVRKDSFQLSLWIDACLIRSIMKCYIIVAVKDVLLERSTESSPQNFEEICEKRLPRGSPQKETLSNKELTARFLKITLISGHDFFCAIYSVRKRI